MINDPVAILRTVLLVGLFAILVLILFKRMKKTLGHDGNKRKYVDLENLNYSEQEGSIVLSWNAPLVEKVNIRVMNSAGSEIFSCDEELVQGNSETALNTGKLVHDKYEVRVKSEFQEITRFLQV